MDARTLVMPVADTGAGWDVRTSWPLLDEILRPFSARIGEDWHGYRNHVLRVANFCGALSGEGDMPEALLVAAAFHDIGIWTHGTFDYLEPSAADARDYLCARHQHDRVDEVQTVIRSHHKLRHCRSEHAARAEIFRRADLVDVSLGTVRFGLTRAVVSEIRRAFPNHGFHWRLVRLTGRQCLKTPLSPLPMLRW